MARRGAPVLTRNAHGHRAPVLHNGRHAAGVGLVDAIKAGPIAVGTLLLPSSLSLRATVPDVAIYPRELLVREHAGKPLEHARCVHHKCSTSGRRTCRAPGRHGTLDRHALASLDDCHLIALVREPTPGEIVAGWLCVLPLRPPSLRAHLLLPTSCRAGVSRLCASALQAAGRGGVELVVTAAGAGKGLRRPLGRPVVGNPAVRQHQQAVGRGRQALQQLGVDDHDARDTPHGPQDALVPGRLHHLVVHRCHGVVEERQSGAPQGRKDGPRQGKACLLAP
mmetsp:Transcript_61013/g.196565  ORF Transcript_61013/g.196565 Transcript_61013/m.196565 type:complete len:280 (+) Transcript_61013:2203-3042(+)